MACVTEGHGLKDLEESLVNSKEQQHQPSKIIGIAWTLLASGLSLCTTVVTGLVSGMDDVPNNMQNFIRCLGAVVTLRIITLCRGECVTIPKGTLQQCIKFGLSDWFFLWGYAKALIFLTALQWGAINNALGPCVASMMGFLFINEVLSKYRMFALVRNSMLALLIVNPFSGGAAAGAGLLTGLGWVLVAAMGTGGMRIVQRCNTSVPGTVLTFWGYVINTLLWFPPGCIPSKLRLPFLQDTADPWAVPAQTWIIMAMSGVLGAGVMVAQGFALEHLDIATYSTLMTPLWLVLATLYSAVKKPLDSLVWAGVALQVAALLFDAYKEKRDAEKK